MVVVARERAEGSPAAVACCEPRCVAPGVCISEGDTATCHSYVIVIVLSFCSIINQIKSSVPPLAVRRRGGQEEGTGTRVKGGMVGDGRAGKKG